MARQDVAVKACPGGAGSVGARWGKVVFGLVGCVLLRYGVVRQEWLVVALRGSFRPGKVWQEWLGELWSDWLRSG